MPPIRRSSWPDRASAVVAAAVGVLLAPSAAAEPAPPPRADSVASVVTPRPPGEPVVPAPAPTSGERELTARDVAAAPLPGFESGRVDEIDDGDSALRKVGRGVLFVPRYVVDLALTPLRGALWLTERYHLPARYRELFFNDAQTIGLYPTVVVDSSLGITAGAAFVHRDLFGERERLRLQAAVGSRYRQIYSAGFATGDRLGRHFSLELDAGYERRPHDAFYGIGNGDTVDELPAGAPIDPRVDPTAMEARYRQDRARLRVTADVRLWNDLHLRPAGELSEVSFGGGDEGDPITTRYDRAGLVGFDGIEYSYAELELRWDSRHAVTVMEPGSVPSAGTLAAVFGGRVNRIDRGPDFYRYGADLAKFYRLARGPRVIVAKLHGEGVTGSRDEVPFTELPKLGGPTYLRGYELDRFRDRVSAFGTLAYQWDLSQWVSASLFTDVGRVYPSLSDLSVDHLRMGYGVSVQGHSLDSFLMELSVASSIDGGLFLTLSFNPVYDLDQRVRRR